MVPNFPINGKIKYKTSSEQELVKPSKCLSTKEVPSHFIALVVDQNDRESMMRWLCGNSYALAY